MRLTRTTAALTLTACLLSSYSIRADVRADEKSRVEFAGMLGRMFNMFGGKAAREGVASTVAVKGNRKATLNDSTGQIIDLDEEKLYDLDLKKKSFKVTTFAELRRQIEEARKKAEEDARKEQQQDEQGRPAERDPNQKEVEVDLDVKNTGEKKAINGFDTHQAVMTITVREKGKTLEQSGGLVIARRDRGPDDGDDGCGQIGRTARAGIESGRSGQPPGRRHQRPARRHDREEDRSEERRRREAAQHLHDDEH
jgi:hypothetical protein